MSGTSLDGLDIVLAELSKKRSAWNFKIEAGTTISYNQSWKKLLSSAHQTDAETLQQLDHAFGHFMGNACNAFISKHKIRRVDLIASHGHTVFHQPNRGFTFQLGNGNALHAATGLPVVFDFRSLDVEYGGEGAPLVPVGDHYLFSDYDVCLNLGGIANLSFLQRGSRKAFDICYANMGLNYLAQAAGKSYDARGRMAENGIIDTTLLRQLSGYYRKHTRHRPSLAREGFEKYVLPLLNASTVSTEDKLRTFVESICDEIASCIPTTNKPKRWVATGGGAFNSFLIDTLRKKLGTRDQLTVPEDEVVNFKEALVFALLGVLRIRGEHNVLKRVTGASQDSSSGLVIGLPC